ncbi:MAG: protein kinase [Pseudomonadota bacterium]
MSTAIIFRKGLCSLLNSAVINILAQSNGTDKAVDLLKTNFTFSAAEIAQSFQESHTRALAAISAGLVSPEQGRCFWKTLLESRIDSERIEQDYLQPFARQHNFSTETLSKFRQTAIEQGKLLAKCTLFQADNVPFTETELASFVTETGTFAITDLVLAQISIPFDERLRAFLSYKDLFGQAILFFLHDKLRQDIRMARTLEALQREGLILDVREIKSLVQSTEEKLNQAVAAKQFGRLGELGPKLENFQKIESVTQTHYAQYFAFQQDFAAWADLVDVQLSDILSAVDNLHWNLEIVHSDVKQSKSIATQISALLEQIMAHADLSPQMKPRDEFTHYSAASLKLINQALRLSKKLSPSDTQFSRVAIGLGSVVSASGNLEKAEVLFIKAYQQAQNNDERALSAFNLFQVYLRHQAYDKALPYLQEAVEFNPQRYALHDVHKYPIERLLGAGGMGCVLLCWQRLNKNKKVVVKCFWETHQGSLDDIFQEPLLMAEIAGEYVPQPLDYGFYDMARQERGFFVTEYYKGAVDGEAWLKAYGKLEIKRAIALGLQIAKALQLAHSKGIFHLDLKPANLLLFPSESVKVIDFGLAKVAKSLQQEVSLKQMGVSVLAQSVFGTFDYAPPEQQGYGGEPSAKSDVYAFGKTLYRLLTGEVPQTLHPRRLADAPALFELLCDCVERVPDKRPDVEILISRLSGLLPQTDSSLPPKPIQAQAPRQVDNRTWWNQLNHRWKNLFRKAIGIKTEPSDSELVKIVKLQELDCRFKEISDLEPLRELTSLQRLNCRSNQISDLEPLCALTNLQILWCKGNQISWWNLRKFKKAVPNCRVYS